MRIAKLKLYKILQVSKIMLVQRLILMCLVMMLHFISNSAEETKHPVIFFKIGVSMLALQKLQGSV